MWLILLDTTTRLVPWADHKDECAKKAGINGQTPRIG
jgi:hypothetical protein